MKNTKIKGNYVDGIRNAGIITLEMSAIIVEIPLKSLPKETVETLKNEAIRCGGTIDTLVAQGAIKLAKQIASSKEQPAKKARQSA